MLYVPLLASPRPKGKYRFQWMRVINDPRAFVRSRRYSGFGHGVIPARGPCDTWIKLLNPEIVLADDVSRTCA